MGRLKFVIITVILLNSAIGLAQELVYDVTIQGKPVGNMLVTKKALDSGKVYYSAVMDLEYKLFRPTEMVQLHEAIYQNDTLRQAYFVEKINGEKAEEAKIEQLLGKKYYRTTIDTTKAWHEKPVINSLVKMYFNQPQKRDSVFSESTHKYNKIAKLPEENRFMMLDDEGEKSIYEYNEKGVCVQRNFNVGAVEYEIKLSEREN
ncbi:hypothetical protein MATR_35510 [Marivirga tractuosa]|uniref:DUF3108 domain-containing protein n=1 Tax=Marivirga tractuosa (strain ATCC 23168 / DSM 4126 / NBRC 15989 / NCIMB 1408 / VKM B-1430 / H-43) TaxID=643867 RepID=E4TPN9_MARTH|nr:DUF6134 family protein [Marivirga tractuosa]ADR22603.1 hypothetical protein Ftrac_2625 [Marivirga tractuosa DSM 4126]BDD16726.1 hypothetical protein MATR_35510 [Marivirga tractuosa]